MLYVLVVAFGVADGIHIQEPTRMFPTYEACAAAQIEVATDLIQNAPEASWLADRGQLKVLCIPVQLEGSPA